MRSIRPVQDKRRWLGLAALSLTASILVPVAIAMACNPQAYLTLNQATYAPGDSVRVSGSFFKNNAQVTVSVDRTGQSTTVTTSGNGAFQATFALPSNAGTGGYSVTAIGYEANGDVVAGLPARGSFSVAAAQATPAPSAPSGGGQPAASAGQPAAAAAPSAGQPAAATATRPTARPNAGTPSSSFREPGVTSEPDVQSSTQQRSSASRSTASAPAPATADRATANGRAVFGGSVAPSVSASSAAPVAAASTATPQSSSQASRPRASSQPAAVSRQAAAQTAADDVWSAVGAGRSPSVLPVAGDGVAVSSPQAGSQLALGLVLLGTGVLALVGGLAAGEARRRRVRAR